jgi:predicted O-methyltransferase YrrM
MVSINLLPLLRDPKLFFKYIRRQSNLAYFLNLSTSEVTKYLRESEQITQSMLRLAENAKLGAMFSPLRGPIVYTCIRALKPAIMIETGVASGSSTTYILQAMELNKSGLLYSIDLPNADPGALVPENKETGWIVPSKLRHRWKLIFGRSQEQLPPLLRELRTIDAFLHDSEHTYETMMFEYETVWPHLSDKGIILSDDIHWNGAFHDFVRNKHPTRFTTFDGLGAIMTIK